MIHLHLQLEWHICDPSAGYAGKIRLCRLALPRSCAWVADPMYNSDRADICDLLSVPSETSVAKPCRWLYCSLSISVSASMSAGYMAFQPPFASMYSSAKTENTSRRILSTHSWIVSAPSERFCANRWTRSNQSAISKSRIPISFRSAIVSPVSVLRYRFVA